MGLTSFIVDIAGALVSPRMSTPKAELPRGRTMAIVRTQTISRIRCVDVTRDSSSRVANEQKKCKDD
jgi:hypothetical protein